MCPDSKLSKVGHEPFVGFRHAYRGDNTIPLGVSTSRVQSPSLMPDVGPRQSNGGRPVHRADLLRSASVRVFALHEPPELATDSSSARTIAEGRGCIPVCCPEMDTNRRRRTARGSHRSCRSSQVPRTPWSALQLATCAQIDPWTESCKRLQWPHRILRHLLLTHQ